MRIVLVNFLRSDYNYIDCNSSVDNVIWSKAFPIGSHSRSHNLSNEAKSLQKGYAESITDDYGLPSWNYDLWKCFCGMLLKQDK